MLLTTHLMEEADILCDNIGILTQGNLRCFGKAMTLKRIFSKGLSLQIVYD